LPTRSQPDGLKTTAGNVAMRWLTFKPAKIFRRRRSHHFFAALARTGLPGSTAHAVCAVELAARFGYFQKP
jgi:hypothetical protein